jgi:phenylalanyl-tRNA synthetase beta subunit
MARAVATGRRRSCVCRETIADGNESAPPQRPSSGTTKPLTRQDVDLMGYSRDHAADFYDVKGCIEDLLETLQIQEARFEQSENIPYLHPGKARGVRVDRAGTSSAVLCP